jgi:uncharacterized protein YegJ (DUF2314 family)
VAGVLALLALGVAGAAWWWRTHREVSLLHQDATFEFGVYFLPTAAADPSRAVDDAARETPGLVVAQGEPTPATGRMQVFVALEQDVATSYAPPEGESLRLFGRGLTSAQAEALSRSRQALRLRFRLPQGDVLPGLRAACRLVCAVARRTGGLVWDEETREVFAPDAWDERRLAPWPEGTVPDVSSHVVIHSYRNDDYLRAVTLGMAKLGLPDLVVESFASSNQRGVGHLLNLTAQALMEGAAPTGGILRLRIGDIGHAGVRTAQQAARKPHAKAEVVLRLREGRRDEGDPANRLLEIGFDEYPGPDLRARQELLLSDLLGWEDAITDVRHDEALLAASRRARERLPAMKALVAAGLQPGQLLLVKSPFPKPGGGNEWMWVEVVAWKGRRIQGVLANEPFEVPGLRAGQEVVVDEGEVFDYVLRNPDGQEEGNETSRLIEEQQRARAPE